MTDVISIAIASISLIISLYVFFSTYLKPAKVNILIGNNLIFFNSYFEDGVGRQRGGISFYLPITFYNWSYRGGEVNQVRMVIGRPDNSLSYCDMVWANFSQITGDAVSLSVETQGVAQPVAIPGQSSVSKIVRFNWSPSMNSMDIQTGQYDLMIFGWTKNEDKPDLHAKTSFVIDEAIDKEYKKHVSSDLILPILISLGDMRLPNNVLTRKGVKNIFGQ